MNAALDGAPFLADALHDRRSDVVCGFGAAMPLVSDGSDAIQTANAGACDPR